MVKEETFGEYGKFGEEKQAEEKPHHLLTDEAVYWLRLALTQTCIDLIIDTDSFFYGFAVRRV